MPQSLMRIAAIAQGHSDAETPGPNGEGNLDALMATMEGEPVYDFFPLGKRFVGMDNTRRYYEHFFNDVVHRMKSYEMCSEAIGPYGAISEYTITLTAIGDTEPTPHRIMSLLVVGENGLTGERMFSDEALFRTLLGPLWDELEPIVL